MILSEPKMHDDDKTCPTFQPACLCPNSCATNDDARSSHGRWNHNTRFSLEARFPTLERQLSRIYPNCLSEILCLNRTRCVRRRREVNCSVLACSCGRVASSEVCDRRIVKSTDHGPLNYDDEQRKKVVSSAVPIDTPLSTGGNITKASSKEKSASHMNIT